MSAQRLPILDEDEDDPMLSAVNLVDVFLVLVAGLLAAVASSSRHAPADAAQVKQAGTPQMELVVKEKGKEVRYKGTGSVSEGEGVRAGVAYRLPDGSIIYVPEDDAAEAKR